MKLLQKLRDQKAVILAEIQVVLFLSLHNTQKQYFTLLHTQTWKLHNNSYSMLTSLYSRQLLHFYKKYYLNISPEEKESSHVLL